MMCVSGFVRCLVISFINFVGMVLVLIEEFECRDLMYFRIFFWVIGWMVKCCILFGILGRLLMMLVRVFNDVVGVLIVCCVVVEKCIFSLLGFI